MAEVRRKIGLIFSYDERWVAGAYYIYNLIHALKTLPDNQLPVLVIFTNSRQEFEKLVHETGYPYLRLFLMQRYDLLSKARTRINNMLQPILGYNLFDMRPKASDAECVFPLLYSGKEYFSKIPRCIFWIPDFQEHFYPHFFSASDLAMRIEYQKELSRSSSRIVFSSCNARDHYMQLYPTNNSIVSVINFAVTHSVVSADVDAIKSRYGISRKYFLCSNQFWKHKNHELVLKAIAIAKKNTVELLVVFTGRPDDHRNPGYYEMLMKMVSEWEISENVAFLGLIPREDQLALLKDARAVIQPSLFEGWSTVIEDAKSFSQFIMASSLDVHKEQLLDYPNACLFDYADPHQLSALLVEYADREPVKVKFDYKTKIDQFVLSFLKAMND